MTESDVNKQETTNRSALNPQALNRQLATDAWLRKMVFVLLVVVVVVIFAMPDGSASGWGSLLIIGTWLGLILINTRVAQTIERIGWLIDTQPVDAEALIARGLMRYPLHASLRLTLYHRLAMLRHRQGRFDETAWIAHAILTHKLGRVEALRSQLLLMLLESQLATANMVGAYMTLMELHRRRLSLVETMHLLPLQIRYELMCGYDAVVLARCDQKIVVAELLSASQAGMVHHLLAIAAHRHGWAKLENFCQRRAVLLCEPEHRQAMSYGAVDLMAE